MMKSRRLALLLAAGVAAAWLPAPGRAVYHAHDAVVSADPADSTPHVLDGKVTAILPLGGRIFVGGTFTQVREAGQDSIFARHGLFAFDPSTGAIDRGFVADFDVQPDPEAAEDRAVEALAPGPDGRTLFVGGTFGTLNGAPQRKLVKLSAATGAPERGFSVSVHTAVKDLVLAGERLIAAGAFTEMNGEPRLGLAAVDAQTGALDPDVNVAFTESRVADDLPRVESIAVTPDRATLVAGGNFMQADGKRRVQVALVDLVSRPARVVDWHTDRYATRDPVTGELECAPGHDTHIRDIDVSPDGTYFVVVTTGGYQSGQLCDTAARWDITERGSGLEPAWVAHDGGDSFTAVAITGAAVYVGGHQRWMNNPFPGDEVSGGAAGPGNVPRKGIAALDPLNGLPLAWDPGRDRGEGAWALVSTAEGLWVGSDTDWIGGEYHPKIAFLPRGPATSRPSSPVTALPADLYTMGLDGTVSWQPFDGDVAGLPRVVEGNADWSRVRGAFVLGQRLYTGQDDGRLVTRTVDGRAFGAPADVDLRGLTSAHFPVADVTGMFADNGRLYYTVAGDRRLFYRYFTAEADVADDVVGGETFVASGEGDGLNWSGVQGMALAAGQLYWAEDGQLHRISFAKGRPDPETHAVVTTHAHVAARGMFLLPSAPPASPPSSPPTTAPPPGLHVAGPRPARVTQSGYWMVDADGTVYRFGDAKHHGDPAGLLRSAEAVDLEPTPSGDGYWILDDGGGVHAFGAAADLGDARLGTMNEWTTSLSATPSGRGYWIFTTKGRALAFGDARHYGDMSGSVLNAPVLDSVPTPSGRGYYMVASDGGIFTFGDARFHGSMGGQRLNAPVQSLVPDGDRQGYWLVASDGGIFSFDAPFRGSTGDRVLNKPVTGMVRFGNGYLMVAEDGGIFNLSDRPFLGSLGHRPPSFPIVSVAALD